MTKGGSVVRVRRVPQRTCVGCRQVKGKKDLIRIVRDPEGNVHLDTTGKASGRGAYICPSLSCLEQAVANRRLEKALARPVAEDLVETLRRRLEESVK
jgi:predicted RNA-binding protein YlxR (DUF448 family)